MKASVTTAAANNEPLTGKLETILTPAAGPVVFVAEKPSVKARVISISRDYLTLEFEPGQQIDFQQGQVVSVSK